jgi:hypothetical protein
MSAHDWRDGIGHFCVADYLAELDDMHLCKALYISPGFTVVICLEHLGAPDVIDSGFSRRKNPPINILPKQHSRGELTLMLDLLVALRSEAARYRRISPKEPARRHIRE